MIIRKIREALASIQEIEQLEKENTAMLSTIQQQLNDINEEIQKIHEEQEIRERLIHVEEKLDNGIPEIKERIIHIEERLDSNIPEIKDRLIHIEEKENDLSYKWEKTGNIRIKFKGLN